MSPPLKAQARVPVQTSACLLNLALVSAISLTLTACNMPALSDPASQKPYSASKDAAAVQLLKAESFAICPDGSRESGINLISDPQSWKIFVDNAHQRAPALSQWNPDFTRSRVVLVKLGSRSSAGYGIKAIDAKLKTGHDELVVTVQTSKPAPDSLSASVLTSPCLLANIADAGFKVLSVYDVSEGKSLGQISR